MRISFEFLRFKFIWWGCWGSSDHDCFFKCAISTVTVTSTLLLYLSRFFSGISCLLHYLFFWQLFTFTPHIFYTSVLTFSNKPLDNKCLINHDSVSLDWQCDSARAHSAPKGFGQSNRCKRLENDERELLTYSGLQVQFSFICE